MSDEIIHAKDLRPGNTFINGSALFEVIENFFNKTAMREGIVKCKVKNLRTGTITIEVLTGGKFTKAIIDTVDMIFSYQDGDNYVFINSKTFESIEIPSSKLKWEKNFLLDCVEIKVQKYNDEILGVKLPDQIICALKDCEDAVQGNTVKSIQKKAWLMNDFEVLVPQFVKKTDRIIVNTKTGEYVGRESK